MGAVGCGTMGKLSPIALAASLHAVPQTAPATSIIDEVLGSWGGHRSRRYFNFYLFCGHFLQHESQCIGDQWQFVYALALNKNNCLNKVLSSLTSLW